MKIWHQYGSEHSANLVMIGHFEDAADAKRVKEIIDALTNQVRAEETSGTRTVGQASSERYGDGMLDLLGKLNLAWLGPQELEQFIYDVNVTHEDSKIIITTEEVDVSAFLKVMVLKGARLEVYSAHDYHDSEHGRGRR